MGKIDLNVDLGEGAPNDGILLGFATSANIACGGHAGDVATMSETVRLCMTAGVMVGAHPGFEDRENFGRKEHVVTPEEVEHIVSRQLLTFLTITDGDGAILHHVKPHGALYHQADRDPELAAAFVRSMQKYCPAAILYAPPNGNLVACAKSAGITAWAECFADRRYRRDGSLVPRGEPGALISDIDEAVRQAFDLIDSGKYQTLCVHGDGDHAISIMREIHRRLTSD